MEIEGLGISPGSYVRRSLWPGIWYWMRWIDRRASASTGARALGDYAANAN